MSHPVVASGSLDWLSKNPIRASAPLSSITNATLSGGFITSGTSPGMCAPYLPSWWDSSARRTACRRNFPSTGYNVDSKVPGCPLHTLSCCLLYPGCTAKLCLSLWTLSIAACHSNNGNDCCFVWKKQTTRRSSRLLDQNMTLGLQSSCREIHTDVAFWRRMILPISNTRKIWTSLFSGHSLLPHGQLRMSTRKPNICGRLHLGTFLYMQDVKACIC